MTTAEMSTCAVCDGEIEWTGQRWRHTGIVIDHHALARTTAFMDAARALGIPFGVYEYGESGDRIIR